MEFHFPREYTKREYKKPPLNRIWRGEALERGVEFGHYLETGERENGIFVDHDLVIKKQVDEPRTYLEKDVGNDVVRAFVCQDVEIVNDVGDGGEVPVGDFVLNSTITVRGSEDSSVVGINLKDKGKKSF